MRASVEYCISESGVNKSLDKSVIYNFPHIRFNWEMWVFLHIFVYDDKDHEDEWYKESNQVIRWMRCEYDVETA